MRSKQPGMSKCPFFLYFLCYKIPHVVRTHFFLWILKYSNYSFVISIRRIHYLYVVFEVLATSAVFPSIIVVGRTIIPTEHFKTLGPKIRPIVFSKLLVH